MVRHVIPSSYREALVHLRDGSFHIVAGGTDIMLKYRNAADLPPRFERDVLYVLNLDELKYIHVEEGVWRIGALTAYETLLDHPEIPDVFKSAWIDIGGPGLRHVATLAGNIANASPAADGIMPLYLYDAQVVLESCAGSRTLPIDAVITGPKQTAIGPQEMIREIIVPKHDFDVATWVKVGTRKADAISKVSFCGAIKVESGVIKDLRLTLGSVAPTVIRARDLEATVKGITLTALEARLDALLDAYAARIRPIDDQRSTKHYRQQVARNLIEDFLKQQIRKG
ncbi:MAG: hypothetical protein EA374_06410 [Acholeplasmatales bacterium]|nr:MAG: hypothetical protein EA374_06410 [Acholeplasmatales bacterium]